MTMNKNFLKCAAAALFCASVLLSAADSTAMKAARAALQEKIRAKDAAAVLTFVEKNLAEDKALTEEEKALLALQSANMLRNAKMNAEFRRIVENVMKNTAVTPETRATAHLRLAEFVAQDSRNMVRTEEALPILDAGLRCGELTPLQQAALMECKAKYLLRLGRAQETFACYDEILKLFPDSDGRLPFLLRKAEAMDRALRPREEICAVYEQALALKDLKMQNEIQAAVKYSDVLSAGGEFKKALAVLDGCITKHQASENKALQQARARVFEDACDYESAIKALRLANDIPRITRIMCVHQNKYEEGAALLASYLRELKSLASAPYGVLQTLNTACTSDEILAGLLRKHIIPAILSHPAGDRAKFRRSSGENYIRRRAENSLCLNLISAAEELEAALEEKPKPEAEFAASALLLEKLGIRGRFDEAKNLLKKLSSLPAPKQQELLSFRLTTAQAALDAGTREKAAKAAEKMFHDTRKTLPADKLAEELAGAASILLLMNERDASEGISDFRAQLYPETEPMTAPCPFMDRAPQFIGDWMNSDIVRKKQGVIKLQRRLGSKTLKQLFETDSNLGERILADEKAAKDGISTEFYTCCDPKGIYVLILGYDDKAKLIDQNFIGGDQYEIYFAPGERQPYHCQIVYPLSDARAPYAEFWSGYPNRFAANARIQDNVSMRHDQALVSENAIATLLFYPWQIFWNVLPDRKGDTYVFDFIRFNRTGAYTWSGTSSVHSRSTWGKLVFDLKPAQIAAIRKNILVYGRNMFNSKAYGKHGRANGPARIWTSPEVGDPAFAEKVVMPAARKVRESFARIKPEMTDDEVNALFFEMAPLYYDFVLIIDRNRKEYLENKFFSE